MVEDRIFIITASHMWDKTWDNDARSMAEEIALHNKVLYITPYAGTGILGIGSSQGDTSVEGRPHLFNPKENIWVVELPPMSMPSSDSEEERRVVFERNHAKFAELMGNLAVEFGIEQNNACLLLDNDLAISTCLSDILHTELALFYHTDYALPEWVSPCKALSRQVTHTANRVNIIITNSSKKEAELRQTNPNTYNIGKGIDLSGYMSEKYPRPADIADIDTPIVGCAGTISTLYLSPDIVFRIADALSRVTVVLLGNKDPLIANHPMHRLPNVRFVGTKSERELPAYIAAFDVCIDPSINNHPNSHYRNAIVEYLALGKTVVCNDMEHVRPFREYVTIARDEGDFIDRVVSALHTRTPWSIRYGRAEFAHTFSWDKVIERLYTVIDKVESE
jgi:glycosyltransferase involved in cell wall biosynthesis